MGSQAAYARHRGVSRNRISVWKSRGLIILDAQGGVNFDESDKMIAEHGGRLSAPPSVRTEAGNVTPVTTHAETGASAAFDGLPSKIESERVRLNYEALLMQLRFEREGAQVAEIEDVAATVLAELAAVRERLAAIGSRIAPRLAGMASAELIKSAIDAEVVSALEELTGASGTA